MTFLNLDTLFIKLIVLGVSVLFGGALLSSLALELAGTEATAQTLADVTLAKVYLSESAIASRKEHPPKSGSDPEAEVLFVYIQSVCTAQLLSPHTPGLNTTALIQPVDYSTLKCNPTFLSGFNSTYEFHEPSCDPSRTQGLPIFTAFAVLYNLGLFVVCTFFYNDEFKMALAFGSCFIFGVLAKLKIFRAARAMKDEFACLEPMGVAVEGASPQFLAFSTIGLAGFIAPMFFVLAVILLVRALKQLRLITLSHRQEGKSYEMVPTLDVDAEQVLDKDDQTEPAQTSHKQKRI